MLQGTDHPATTPGPSSHHTRRTSPNTATGSRKPTADALAEANLMVRRSPAPPRVVGGPAGRTRIRYAPLTARRPARALVQAHHRGTDRDSCLLTVAGQRELGSANSPARVLTHRIAQRTPTPAPNPGRPPGHARPPPLLSRQHFPTALPDAPAAAGQDAAARGDRGAPGAGRPPDPPRPDPPGALPATVDPAPSSPARDPATPLT